MSRNLCTSSCCGNTLRLSDLRGKPIEFRRYAKEPPVIGTRWICPTCGTVYFAWWRDAEWSIPSGKYVRGFVIDLSYYESFNDEHRANEWSRDSDQVDHLCLDDATDIQEVW